MVTYLTLITASKRYAYPHVAKAEDGNVTHSVRLRQQVTASGFNQAPRGPGSAALAFMLCFVHYSLGDAESK